MRPFAISDSALAILTALHTEFFLRGVKRILYECSSILVRTPSIHP